jgi:hypothetical protein
MNHVTSNVTTEARAQVTTTWAADSWRASVTPAATTAATTTVV